MEEILQTKRILCYGDSLTAGYYRYGSEFHPYGDTLAKLSHANVDAVGMSGWTSDEMVQNANLSDNEDAVGYSSDGLIKLLKSKSYDIVCVLAGTNDLGTGVSADDIIENLQASTRICLETNDGNQVKVLLLTVPPSRAEQYTGPRRSIVNSALASIASQHFGRVFVADAGSALPIAEVELWDSDMLHLSPKGSERLGQFVYDQLCASGLLGNDSRPM